MAVEPRPVTARTRYVCAGLAVSGSVLVMAGVMLGSTAAVVGLPGRWPMAGMVAWVLIAGGMFCGAVLIPASGLPRSRSRARAGRTRRGTMQRSVKGPGESRSFAPPDAFGQPGAPGGPSEEWIRALHPGAPSPEGEEPGIT